MNERALDAIIPANAKIEKLAGGFLFTERPVWVPASENSPGYLLFSDPNNNTIYRWSQDGQVSVFKTKSGYAGVDIGEYNQPGSNGLALIVKTQHAIGDGQLRIVLLFMAIGSVLALPLAGWFVGRFHSGRPVNDIAGR